MEEFVALPHCPVHDSPHAGAVMHQLVRQNKPQSEGKKFLPLSSIETRKELIAPKKRKELIAKAKAAGMAVPRHAERTLFPTTLSSLRLLGESQKVVKGLKRGVVTAVLYLSPDTEAFSGEHGVGKTLCPWSTAGCSAACLGHESGQMGLPDSANARLWRTVLYAQDKTLFWRMLNEEIADFERRVHELAPGLIPAVRLDGTSDMGLAERVAPLHPGVVLYDYTKSYPRMTRFLNGEYPENWHLTFSYSGENLDQSLEVLRRGGNVAVVFGVPAERKVWRIEAGVLPCSWHSFPVEDADATDVRFQDCPGRVAGLRFKWKKGSVQTAIEVGGSFAQRMPEGWPHAERPGHGWPGPPVSPPRRTTGMRLPTRGNPRSLAADRLASVMGTVYLQLGAR